ncbi:hypothetical protein [Rhodopseudomonas sp. AAP120]|uniref:hypothetical protein n=1 Tax=Rhodopseudomonas sp. AAP120 TaxID=1523430 RepID=UPI000B07EFDD|nr:hypothetical protein [Rhodopseudomonas sp. AAP120]
MNAELLNLSWQIQVALASGYSAYMLAYFGLRHAHKQIDTIFIALVFSLMASGVISALGSREGFESPILQGGTAFIATSAAAMIWRKWGRRLLGVFLRFVDMSWSDNDPSALITLTSSTEYFVSQIAVQLDDGTWLRCDDTSKFKGAPFYPCLIGPAGDIAFYLTHEEPIGQKAKELSSVRDLHYGDRLTYIPAQRIKQITVRHVGKISHS